MPTNFTLDGDKCYLLNGKTEELFSNQTDSGN